MQQRSLKINFNRLLAEKALKEDSYISLREVAAETGITIKTLENTWSQNDKGIFQIHVPTADRLCQYFDCDFGDLVSFE